MEQEKKDNNNNTAIEKSNPRFQIKKFGISARLDTAKELIPTDVSGFANRIGIIFDDSGSMSGEPIESAHTAIDTFVKNCNSFDTALAIYPLNAIPKKLTNNFLDIAMYGMSLRATGGTPLYTKLIELIDSEKITRAVAFSDGQPTGYGKETCFEKYRAAHIPVDAIFIGTMGYGDAAMRELAEMTGGIFLHFTDASVLATSFKYLTPAYRAMLMSPEFKAKVEKGEV